MNLHGVDIFIWSSTTPEVPKEIGKFTLILISNRGTKIYPGPAPEIELLDWPRTRYCCDSVVTDAEVDEIVQKISALGFTWTKCQKLYRSEDGTNLYSEPY